MTSLLEAKEYQCSAGHTFKSITEPKDQKQTDEYCIVCTRNKWKEERDKILEARRIEWRRGIHANIEDYISHTRNAVQHISNLERVLQAVAGIWVDAKILSHDELIRTCTDLLILEGADPKKIRLEYAITIANKKYVADIVVLDEKEQIHTIIECGNLSDPVKIQLFDRLYPRFIWIPFTLVPNMEIIKSYREQVGSILKECKEATHLLADVVGDVHFMKAVAEMEMTSFKEVWNEIAAEEQTEQS